MNQNAPPAINDLIAAIYRAATEPAEWGNVFEAIAVLFDGHAAFTMTVGPGPHDEPGLFCYNLPLEAVIAYGDYYHQHDLWSPRWIGRGLHGLGNVHTGDQLVGRDVFLRSVWFNEYLRVFDIEHSLFASLSELTDTPFILAIDRPVGSEPFSLSDTERLRPIGLHLSQAIKMFRQFQVLNNGIQAHEHYLDTLNRGIVSVNLKGKLLYANAFAMDVLIRQEGLTVRNGLLCGVNEEGDMALAAMLALAKQGVGQAFALARSPSSPPLKIQSVPMAGDKTAMDVLPECEAGKVLLLFSVESVLPANAYQCFAKVHRLTCQETKVLQGIVEGYVLKEIAERHAVSVNTVRSQLASLMQKTYCKRQKDLVRLFFCATNPRS